MKDDNDNGIEVLEFEHGVRAYPPSKPGAYWRLRWEEEHRRRETTAKGRADAVAKATEIVERLASGVGSEVANARGCVLVAHYLARNDFTSESTDRSAEFTLSSPGY